MSLFSLIFGAHLEALGRKIDRVLEAVRQLETKMEFDISELRAETAAIKNASDAAEALLNGISAKLDAAIEENKGLPALRAAITEISSTLRTEAEELGAAVVKHTPAEEPAPTP